MTGTATSSAAATAGGCLQQQPASGEEEEEILGEISHIEPSEHLRNVVPAYGSLDPAATVAGASLKGITFNFEFYAIHVFLGSVFSPGCLMSERSRFSQSGRNSLISSP